MFLTIYAQSYHIRSFIDVDELDNNNLSRYEVHITYQADNSTRLDEYGEFKEGKIIYIQTDKVQASDSIVFQYNSKNQLIKKVLHRTIKDDEVGWFAETQEDTNGRTIETVTTNYVYDSQNNLISKKVFNSLTDNSPWEYTFSYDNDSRVNKKCVSSIDNFCQIYNYDEKDNLTSIKRFTNKGDTITAWKKYNEFNQVIEELSLDEEYLLPPSHIFYYYDADKNLIKEKIVDPYGEVWVKTFDYNSDNQLIGKKEQSQNHVISLEKYTYHNELIKKKIILDTETEEPRVTVELKYYYE